MSIQPNYLTASLAGVWSALGLRLGNMLEHAPGAAGAIPSTLMMLPLFVLFVALPGYFLVLGKQRALRKNWFMQEDERAQFVSTARRFFVWILSVGATGTVWTVARMFLVG